MSNDVSHIVSYTECWIFEYPHGVLLTFLSGRLFRLKFQLGILEHDSKFTDHCGQLISHRKFTRLAIKDSMMLSINFSIES